MPETKFFSHNCDIPITPERFWEDEKCERIPYGKQLRRLPSKIYLKMLGRRLRPRADGALRERERERERGAAGGLAILGFFHSQRKPKITKICF